MIEFEHETVEFELALELVFELLTGGRLWGQGIPEQNSRRLIGSEH
jgi:hypothetical protein